MTDQNNPMAGHIVGLGGVFFKSSIGDETIAWYKSLGMRTDQYGATFGFREDDMPENRGYAVLAPFKADTDYMKPSEKDFMINLRVRDLAGLIPKLKEAGIEVLEKMVVTPEGNFTWICDPNGIKYELWEQLGEAPAP